jgi:hypothetical protein
VSVGRARIDTALQLFAMSDAAQQLQQQQLKQNGFMTARLRPHHNKSASCSASTLSSACNSPSIQNGEQLRVRRAMSHRRHSSLTMPHNLRAVSDISHTLVNQSFDGVTARSHSRLNYSNRCEELNSGLAECTVTPNGITVSPNDTNSNHLDSVWPAAVSSKLHGAKLDGMRRAISDGQAIDSFSTVC